MKTASYKYHDKTDGFTVIETLIVLAIAGLILMIILMALPALERSSRNNQRRQDIQTILAAVSHYELNDSGNFPKDCGGLTNCTSPVGSTNDYFLRYVASKLSYYTANNQVFVRHQTSRATPNPDPNNNVDQVYIYNYQKCQSTGGTSTWQGAGYSDIVALYAIETSSSISPQCQQL